MLENLQRPFARTFPMNASILSFAVTFTFAITFPGGAFAEVRIGPTAITPETPALYLQYVKYLTVPPNQQANPVFNGSDVAAIKALEDPVRREIYDRMGAAHPETFPFSSIADAQRHWVMRLTIMDDMLKMNQGIIDFRYHDKSKNIPISAGTNKWKLGSSIQFYFEVNPNQTAYDGIKSLIAGHPRGECAGAITTCFLDAAATALGQPAFDAIHPPGTLKIGFQSSFDKHRYLGTSAVFIPGDIAYFKNKADYLTKCKARNVDGFWQGENTVYMGNLKGCGLGTASPNGGFLVTAAEMRAQLKAAYELDTKTTFEGDPVTEIPVLPPLRPWLNMNP